MSKYDAWIDEQIAKAKELQKRFNSLPWMSEERKQLQAEWLKILDNVATLNTGWH